MQHSTSKLLRSILAGGFSAALALFTLPAAAHGTVPRRAAHPVRAYAAPRYRAVRAVHPVRAYAAPRYRAMRAVHPVRAYAAPRYRAARAVRPVRAYAAPRYRAVRAVHPVRAYAAPRYRAVRAVHPVRAYAAPRYRAARAVHPVRAYAAPRYRAARAVHPVRAYAAPRYRVARVYSRRTARGAHSAPFVERVRVKPYRRERRTPAAPFIEYVRAPRARAAYVRAPRARAAYVPRYRVVRSPLMRAIYAPRARRTVAYHPAYLTGRVVRTREDLVVLQSPAGSDIPVRCGCAYRYRTGAYAMVPAVYDNGAYYGSPYSRQYYPQVAQWYSNYYGAPVSYSNGYYVPQNAYAAAPAWSAFGQNDGDGDETAGYGGGGYYGSGYGNGYGSSGAYAQPYYGSSGYAPPYYANSPYGAYGAPGYTNGYTNGYGTPYAPEQVQGLVLAKAGSILMVLGANGLNPVLVDAGPAYQNGSALNGPVAAGQVIDAYGYYSGNTFIATALM